MSGAFDFTVKCSSGDPKPPRSDAAGRAWHFSTPATGAGESQLTSPKPQEAAGFLIR